jgi:hypothetical protein
MRCFDLDRLISGIPADKVRRALIRIAAHDPHAMTNSGSWSVEIVVKGVGVGWRECADRDLRGNQGSERCL